MAAARSADSAWVVVGVDAAAMVAEVMGMVDVAVVVVERAVVPGIGSVPDTKVLWLRFKWRRL